MAREEFEDRPERLSPAELRDVWRILDAGERVDGFRLVAPDEAEEFFLALTTARPARPPAVDGPGRAPDLDCACCRPTTPPT